MSDATTEAPTEAEGTEPTPEAVEPAAEVAEKPKRKVNRGRADLSSSTYEEIDDATNTGQARETHPSTTNPHKPPAQMSYPDGDPEWGHLPVQMRHNEDGTPAF